MHLSIQTTTTISTGELLESYKWNGFSAGTASKRIAGKDYFGAMRISNCHLAG
jgi:hypothetical protein